MFDQVSVAASYCSDTRHQRHKSEDFCPRGSRRLAMALGRGNRLEVIP